MQYLSRLLIQTKVLIVLAVAFIVSTLYIQINNAKTAAPVRQALTPSPTIARSLTDASGTPQKQFDINESYECKYASTSAFIHKKQMYMETKTATSSSYKVFTGDCLYTWQQVKSVMQKGQKSCGLGQYISMYELASRFGILNLESVLSQVGNTDALKNLLPASGSAALPNIADIKKQFATSCSAAVKVDENLFKIPSNITFSEKKK